MEARVKTALRTVASLLALLAISNFANAEDVCSDADHQKWLNRCLDHVGSKSPVDWQWSIPASGYYGHSDLVREFTSDCVAKSASPVDTAKNLCPWQGHVDWLSACVAELEDLVGRPASELAKVVGTEGGINVGIAFRHYQHKRCFPLKAEITTRPNPVHPDDESLCVITKVVPYIGWAIMD